MISKSSSIWLAVESDYVDEFGHIDAEVYQIAGEVWSSAQAYAKRLIGDDPETTRLLLLKAAAKITRVRRERADEIHDVAAYLFTTFKRLVLAELERNSHHRAREAVSDLQRELRDQAKLVEQKILFEEIVGQMDDWTRSIFEWLTMGYTFEEIANHLKANSQVVRNKYRRHIEQLTRRIKQ